MSAQIFSRAWANSGQTGEHLLTLLAMADQADPETGICVLNPALIARKARVSVDRLKAILLDLEEAEEISRAPCELGWVPWPEALHWSQDVTKLRFRDFVLSSFSRSNHFPGGEL